MRRRIDRPMFHLRARRIFPEEVVPFQFVEGRIGRGANPPPQLGQTFPKTSSTQAAQIVHSYEQIRASSDSGGRALLQCSQVGRSSSMGASM
jgi:hypothetical protein